MERLCLACSSSLPPSRPAALSQREVFTTRCCRRPICPSCVTSNPRLTRYDPCLACLGGVAAVDRRSREGDPPSRNVDGAVRDQDTFVLGDDDEKDSDQGDGVDSPSEVPDPPTSRQDGTPERYYIRSNDTLQGLAFRFGVDGRELCRLNHLPPSTLSTTPHLLHTRTSITLPPTASEKVGCEDRDEERESRRARERAEKRLQMLTKEVDWRVAKAYVAMAEEDGEYERKSKEGHEFGETTLASTAIERYLSDSEWEERQGRVCIPRLRV